MEGQEANWHHGSLSRDAAELLLEKKEVGTFLFRDSESRSGFSLSLRVHDKTKHYMVRKQPSGLYMLVGKQHEFETISELIEFFRSTPASTTDGVCLKFPCPRETTGRTYVSLADDDEVNYNALDEVKELAKRKVQQNMMRRLSTDSV
eukprot:m.38279 g.38279  ORF g.38279 m.38279 type:complete len:148 (+) comp11630_c0_seq1:197-640(+)